MDSKKASTTNSKTKQKKHIVMQLQNRTFISEIALPYVCIFSKFFGEFPRKIFTFLQKYDRINREQQNQAQWGSMLTEQEGSSNMVYVTGDLHGDYSRFKRPEMKKLRAGDILLVCGDFGFIWDNSKQEQAVLKKLSEKKYTIAFVDGCHENFDLLQQYRLVRWRGGVVRLIAPNIFHLQRGEIYTIENQKYFAFGGGHSQDYEYRRDTGNWWRQEQPTHDEIRRAIRNLNRNQATVDYIITHEPPASLKDCLGVDVQQRLEIHAFFEDIIKECDYKKWFFGKCHMDRFIPMKFYAVFQDVLPVTDERN